MTNVTKAWFHTRLFLTHPHQNISEGERMKDAETLKQSKDTMMPQILKKMRMHYVWDLRKEEIFIKATLISRK